MKNTLALAIILLGGMLVYGGYKDYSFADTIRFFTGQKMQKSGISSKGFQDVQPKPVTPKTPNGFTPSNPNSSPSGGAGTK